MQLLHGDSTHRTHFDADKTKRSERVITCGGPTLSNILPWISRHRVDCKDGHEIYRAVDEGNSVQISGEL